MSQIESGRSCPVAVDFGEPGAGGVIPRRSDRLNRACCKPITGSIEPIASRLQARSSLLQADYRLNRACCKPITGSIEPVASRLQTKTSRLQACCNIYFSPLSNCSQFKSAKKGFENEKCLKIPFFLLQTRSNVKLLHNKNV